MAVGCLALVPSAHLQYYYANIIIIYYLLLLLDDDAAAAADDDDDDAAMVAPCTVVRVPVTLSVPTLLIIIIINHVDSLRHDVTVMHV